ncbi:hemolysin family protein [Alienimonas californiensis]|uniref:Magnesium and cobalt efflux protein CorC n=1 Tax=Alienimonas californiensis TaxID=2527989 RepID=A0A517PFN1_9PLAN|nr:hemolysin family protein [Alienimonas californiensis]QDT18180.1 Magnesium and cobalt efflux protein CorC [Alienimonas californiensis]
MEPPLLYAALTGAAAFVCGVFTQSLREFSRGKLHDLCTARGLDDRFGEVLKNRESVLVVTRAATFVLNAACLLLAAGGLGLPLPGHADEAVWRRWETWAEWAAFTAIAVLLLSVLPWTVARVTSEALLARAWPLASVLAKPFAPFVALSNYLDRTMHRLAGRADPDRDDASVLNDELKSVVDEGEREGLLEIDAGRMIRQVIELHDEDVAAVMTPRTAMDTVPATATLEEARELFMARGHSRLPVHGESLDDIRGVLYAKDLLASLGASRAGDGPVPSVAELAREPLFVPDATKLDTLLSRMKTEQTHLALVVDEYGGVAGLVTMEDLLEEIVGEIVDEHDPITEAETGIRRLSAPLPEGDGDPRDRRSRLRAAKVNGTPLPRSFEVEGWVRTDDFNETAGFSLPEDGDFDTLGGFVLSELTRVPNAGETFDWKGVRVTVLEADNRKVDLVRVEDAPPES